VGKVVHRPGITMGERTEKKRGSRQFLQEREKLKKRRNSPVKEGEGVTLWPPAPQPSADYLREGPVSNDLCKGKRILIRWA